MIKDVMDKQKIVLKILSINFINLYLQSLPYLNHPQYQLMKALVFDLSDGSLAKFAFSVGVRLTVKISFVTLLLVYPVF